MHIKFDGDQQVTAFLEVERRAIRKVLKLYDYLSKQHGEEEAMNLLRKAAEEK